jgi:hypothetical protein
MSMLQLQAHTVYLMYREGAWQKYAKWVIVHCAFSTPLSSRSRVHAQALRATNE